MRRGVAKKLTLPLSNLTYDFLIIMQFKTAVIKEPDAEPINRSQTHPRKQMIRSTDTFFHNYERIQAKTEVVPLMLRHSA